MIRTELHAGFPRAVYGFWRSRPWLATLRRPLTGHWLLLSKFPLTRLFVNGTLVVALVTNETVRLLLTSHLQSSAITLRVEAAHTRTYMHTHAHTRTHTPPL
jgi:hypothetical protein